MAVLVLSYLGNNILHELVSHQEHNEAALVLVNSDGFYIKGFQPDTEWGSQLPERSRFKLATEYPELAEQIRKNKQGPWENKGTIYNWTTATPGINDIVKQAPSWALISAAPLSLLNEHLQEDIENRFKSLVFLLLASLSTSLTIATIKARKELMSEEISLLLKTNQIFLKDPSTEVYHQVLDTILLATESRHGLFGFIDDRGNMVCPSMTKDIFDQCEIPDKAMFFPYEKYGPENSPWGQSLWAKAIREQKTLLANRSFRVPEGHLPIHNVLLVPIINSGKTIGIMVVANKQGGYTARDLRLLEIVASNISPTMQSRLETARKEWTRAKLAIEQADSLERIEVLLRNRHHEAKNEMADLAGIVRMLWREISDQVLKQKIHKLLDKIMVRSYLHELLHKSDNLLSVSTEKMFKLFNQIFGDRARFKLSTPEDLKIDNQQVRFLGEALNELVLNAVEHGSKATDNLEISLSARLVGDTIEITIADNGSGIPNDQNPFSNKSRGLRSVKDTIKNRLKGNLELLTVTQGTSWRITFPILPPGDN